MIYDRSYEKKKNFFQDENFRMNFFFYEFFWSFNSLKMLYKNLDLTI